jgi:hypothetical protein
VKTRLTTIKGYAQLLEREIDRSPPPSGRLGSRVQELNREIERLIELVGSIESSIMDDIPSTSDRDIANGDDYVSSAR